MAEYLASNSIKVYPTSHRDKDIDTEAYFTTEKNVTSDSMLGFSNKRYVSSDGTNLIIVINGYRFETTVASVIALSNYSASGEFYAYIKTVYKDSTHNTFKELVRASDSGDMLDSNNVFYGLAFDSTIPVGCDGICVFKNGAVPASSKLNVSKEQISNGYFTDSDKPISEEFTTKNVTTEKLTATDDVKLTKIKGSKDLSVALDSTGKLMSYDETSSYTRPTDSVHSNIQVLQTINQDSKGKLTYTSGNLPLASNTMYGIVSTGAQTFAGAKTFIAKATFNSGLDAKGNVTVSDGSTTKATIASSTGNIETAGTIKTTNTTASTSSTTGALVTAGGLGVAKKIYAGEEIQSAKTITANSGSISNDNVTLVGMATCATKDGKQRNIYDTYVSSVSKANDASISTTNVITPAKLSVTKGATTSNISIDKVGKAIADESGNRIQKTYGAKLQLKSGTTDTIQLLDKTNTSLGEVRVPKVQQATQADSLFYRTVAPTEKLPTTEKLFSVCVLTSVPPTLYDGYLYIITD